MDKNKSPNNFIKYSGLAFQMIGVLLFFTWLGRKGDAYFEFKTPWLTLLAIIFALVGVFYKIILDFSKK
ncbi:MAG: AtpZ/AtpI family protein [Flavobacteriales bacterium]|nr:AtpZ/AtpI family protein [Flavobacteriales bacterium]